MMQRKTRRRGPRPGQGGQTMMTVMVAIMVTMGASVAVLSSLKEDIGDQQAHQRYTEAREAAEAGLMEFVNDRQVRDMLPTPSTSGMKRDLQPSPGSRFVTKNRRGEDFRGEIRLVRIVPVRESSQSLVRAVIYEASVEGERSEQAVAGIEAQIYRMTVNQVGRVAPRVHAR